MGNIYLSKLDIGLIIATASAVVIGLIIFFFAGLYRVPKNHALIFEKAGKFVACYDKGVHFKFPIVYQRVGVYCIVPQTRVYKAKNGNKLDVTFVIKNPVDYHYSSMRFDNIMKMIEKENEDISLQLLQDTFSKYGLEFISIKKSEY